MKINLVCKTKIYAVVCHNSNYYSFKIFLRFWLVETTRIIHYNQLLFTKFGKKLRHIESMTSKVQPAADYWTNDVKSAACCRWLNRWPKKPGDEIVYFLLAWKWLRVGLESWAKKILLSYLMIKTVRIPKSRWNNIAQFWVLPEGEKHQKSYNCSGVSGSFTKVLRRGEKKGWTDVLKKIPLFLQIFLRIFLNE